MRGFLLGVAGVALALPTVAQADTYPFLAQYFTIQGTYGGQAGGDPDFNTIGCCNGVFTDEVMSTLGPNGLPVYNPNYGDAANHPLHDVNASGELTWWSPTMNPNVTASGTGVITSPFFDGDFYPPDGTGSNDGPGSNFLGAIFSGDLVLATDSAVQFTLGADDDAFLYVDGTIVTQIGGIHGLSAAPTSTPTLSAGTHSFELFYVDRNQTGAALQFSIDTQGIIVTPPAVPEPATWAMMIGGFGLVGAAMRRRVNATVRYA